MIDGIDKVNEEKILGVLAQYPDVRRAVLYGSRSKNTYRKGSDIDLALLGRDLTFPTFLDIHQKMDDLLLPYMIDFCLYKTLKNPALRKEIASAGRVIYSRGE